jgi:hypothetical protein
MFLTETGYGGIQIQKIHKRQPVISATSGISMWKYQYLETFRGRWEYEYWNKRREEVRNMHGTELTKIERGITRSYNIG